MSDESGQGQLYPSLFDLNMLVGTPCGRCYSNSEIKELLENFGARRVRYRPIRLGSSLVIGEK